MGGRRGSDSALPEHAVSLYNLPAGTELEMRTWQEGDRFHARWKSSPAALVAFLRGQRVPLEQRRHTPLICRAGTREVLAVLEPRHVAKGFDGPEAEASPSAESGGGGGSDRRAVWVALDETGQM